MQFPFFTKKPTKKSMSTTSSFIIFNGEEIPYTLKHHSRTKYIRITLKRDGKITVSAPRRASKEVITRSLSERKDWILAKREYYRSLPPLPSSADTKKEYEKHKESALKFVNQKIQEINTIYNFTYNEVHIKNQKTLWGSCSRRGNLNFNYKIVLIREELADYIVAHEVCHLKEFNHGEKFWNLVAQAIPNHKELRKELKTIAKIS